VLFMLASGCATYEPVKKEVSQAVEDWHRPAVQLGPREAGERSGIPAAGRSALPKTVDEQVSPERRSVPSSLLSGYVLEALERNPTVKAAAADAQAKLERIAQVTSLPDPILRAIVRPEPIQTAAGDIYFTLGVGQKIPLPGRLERAGRIAVAEVRTAVERLNAARLRVIADVEQAYYRLYLTDRSIELTRAHRQSLEDLERVLATQYQVGRAEQQDLLRIQIEIAELRDEESGLQRRRASTAAALNQLLDYPPTRELPATKRVTPQAFDTDVDQLITLAAEHNPALAILTHQAERDREEIALADLGYWPDPTIGFEWTYVEPRDAFEPAAAQSDAINRMSETGSDSWALMLQFNLPIWFDRLEAAKREARLKLQQTQHERHAALNMISFRIFDAWSRVQTRQDTIKLLESTLIPQCRQTYEVSLTAYQAGRSEFLTVIDNWRRLLDFELMLHRETADLETTLSELQREVGLQLIRHEIAPETEDQGEQP
jgi:cobalt-zinc-cadmium efflux system outer membrane protein